MGTEPQKESDTPQETGSRKRESKGMQFMARPDRQAGQSNNTDREKKVYRKIVQSD